jgi:hypothetical protein
MTRRKTINRTGDGSGVFGGRAVFDQLDRLAGGVRSDVGTERGLSARLHYLTKSGRGFEAMDRAGIDVTARTMASWLAEDHTPSKSNRAKIDEAYHALRKENIASLMKARLNNGGRGTRIEIHPEDQSSISEKASYLRRNLNVRDINILDWDDIVDAWAADDDATMEVIWDEICDDAGTDGDAYQYVAGVGFAA